MGGRAILRIVLVLLIAGVAFVAVRAALTEAPTEQGPPPKIRVAFAAADLPKGLLIRPQDIVWTEIPADARQDSHVVQGEETATQLVGAVVRTAVTKGDAIQRESVVLPSAPGFLSAALKPDMRAVSVAIDEVSGNAGLILPGDFVDLILTQTVGESRQSASRPTSRIVSETVLSNVRVIAVGRTLRVTADPDSDRMAPAKARTMTLEVRPSEAEVVAVASRLGSLSLALRSLATLQRPEAITASTGPEMGASTPVWAEDVSVARRLTAPPEDETPEPARMTQPTSIRVIRGSSATDITGREPAAPSQAADAAALR